MDADLHQIQPQTLNTRVRTNRLQKFDRGLTEDDILLSRKWVREGASVGGRRRKQQLAIESFVTFGREASALFSIASYGCSRLLNYIINDQKMSEDYINLVFTEPFA